MADDTTFETNWMGYLCLAGLFFLLAWMIALHYIYAPQPIVFKPVIVVRESDWHTSGALSCSSSGTVPVTTCQSGGWTVSSTTATSTTPATVPYYVMGH